MAIKVLVARDRGIQGHYYEVHVDDSRVQADGSPDLSAVLVFNWGADVSKPVAQAEMRRQAQELAVKLSATKTSGSKIAIEGTTI